MPGWRGFGASCVLLGAGTLLVAVPLGARSPAGARGDTSYFLAGNPHVPLAQVVAGRIRNVARPNAHGKSCGPKQRWAGVGSKWHAVDGWGQIVGTVSIDARDFYDVTGCLEVSFAPALARHSALVFVSVDSAWHAAAPARWNPPAVEQARFEALLAETAKGHSQRDLPETCTEVAETVRYFQVAGQDGKVRRYAVGGLGGAYVVASFDGSWSAELVRRERIEPGGFVQCYRPLGVFDMNGDGSPEVILRGSEGVSWGDFVLTLEGGKWRVVAQSPGGATI